MSMSNTRAAALIGITAMVCIIAGGAAGIGLSCNFSTYLNDELGKAKTKLRTCERRNKNLQELRVNSSRLPALTKNVDKVWKRVIEIANSKPDCSNSAISAIQTLIEQNASLRRRKLTGCLPTKLNCRYPIDVTTCRVETFHNDRTNRYLMCRIVKKGK